MRGAVTDVRDLVGRLFVFWREPDRVRSRKGAFDSCIDPRVIGRGVGVEIDLKLLFRPAELNAVLRALWPGDRRHNGREVELEVLAVHRLDRRVVPQVLQLRIGLDELDLTLAAAGEAQVVERHVVDREHRGGRTELRAHVANRRAVRERHFGHSCAVELDELANDAVLAQLLGDREHDIRRGDCGRNRAGELEPDHLRDEHGNRLAEHRGLRFDAADAPSEHTEAVDHGRVGVSADTGIGIRAQHAVDLASVGHAREVLDVDLVHDAGSRRNDLEVVKRGLAPAQELVAFTVSLVFDFDVALQRILRAENVGDDGVVDDHLGWRQWVDLGRVSPECFDGLAHRGEVDNARHAGKVLHDHARGRELNLGIWLRRRNPRAERSNVLRRDIGAVFGAKQILKQHREAERELLKTVNGIYPKDFIVRALNSESALRTEAVNCGHLPSPLLTWLNPCARQAALPARQA